tara:strand:- start:1043 stop:1948 length:906 start_codon:yes stop_codon:yes gene_type:complete
MKIKEIATALGENEIKIDSLFNHPGLVEKTGISQVYSTNHSTVDLATRAVLALKINKTNFKPKLLVLVTQSPDDALPANSIKLAYKANLPTDILTFDINQGCSGFVQAFCIISKLLGSYNEILLVTADRYRSKLRESDRSTNAVFSDGSTASLISNEGSYNILFEDHMTAGDKRDLLFQSNGDENDGFLHMSGAEVWLFTKREVVPQINKAIKFSDDNGFIIKGVYLHQASKLVVDGMKDYIELDSELFFANYNKHGNTVSSSIPFLIKDFPISLQKGEVVIMAGFGVGLTSTILVYGKEH